MRIEVITYTDEKLKYFQDKQKAISKKYENLKSKSIGVSYTPEQMQKLSDCGRELSFYNDIVEMLEKDVVPRSEVDKLRAKALEQGKRDNVYGLTAEELAKKCEQLSIELEAMRGAANSYKMHYEQAQAEKDNLIKNYAECQKEVAEQIFEEIEETLTSLDKRYMLDFNPKQAWGVRGAMAEITELKKKYIG